MDDPNHLEQGDGSSVAESGEQVAGSSISSDPLVSFGRALLNNRNALRQFLSLTGGSILYCLSAFSILYGIAQVIGPLLATSNVLKETLPCVVALNAYELALLGVLLLIVLWREVTDDAISLVVLVGLFLVASGAILSVVAPAGPDVCLYIGLACVVVGVAKLFVMRRFISFRLGSLSLSGLTIVLLWNFLASSLIAKFLVSGAATPEAARERWLLGWLVLLGGAAMVLAEAMRSEPGRSNAENDKTAFLRTPSMVWIFGLVVLTAAGLHQYGMAHMLAIEYAFGDFIPLIALGSLLLFELMRSLGKRREQIEVVICCLPLGSIAYAVARGTVIARAGYGLELLWNPSVILGTTGLLLLWLGIRHKRRWFFYAFLAYGLGFLLMVGFSPDRPHELNWMLCGAGVVVTLLSLGVVKKNAALCFAGILVLSGGLAPTDILARFARAQGMTVWGTAAGIMGLGSIAISLGFGRKAQRAVTLLGAVCLIACIFDYLGWSLALKDIAVGAGVVALCVVLWVRTRDVLAVVVICVPVGVKLYVLVRKMPSWGFVLLSFFLLFSGAFVSLFCKRRKSLQDQSEDISPSQ